MTSSKVQQSSLLRTTLIPLFLMLASPPFILLLWVLAVPFNGNLLSAFSNIPKLLTSFPSPTIPGAVLALLFLLAQGLLLILLPGERFTAVVTPMGNRPTYKLNGVVAFIVTQLAVFGLWKLGGENFLAYVYDVYGEMLAFLTYSAPFVTGLLYLKGLLIPTNTDSGKSGNGVIWDLWQGTELHPEIFGISLKQWVNCRFAMMGWSVVVVAFAAKQREVYGKVSNSMWVSMILQLVYCGKFFYWESGYFNSIDIIHDRFGYYICWGCLAFLPSVYTLTSLYLVTHPLDLPSWYAGGVLLLGLVALCANYDTDRQRQHVRATNGETLVWGEKPKLVSATYETGDGKKRSTFLLASGWWGLARHVNYAWELLLAYMWCAPAGTSGILPYTYAVYLTILLVDRAYRDELRCLEKYGKYYEEYRKKVPYKIVPYVY